MGRTTSEWQFRKKCSKRDTVTSQNSKIRNENNKFRIFRPKIEKILFWKKRISNISAPLCALCLNTSQLIPLYFLSGDFSYFIYFLYTFAGSTVC
jgi:hypothetical protein